ncbi:MAG: ATP-dependent zinc metalloprotease FtsH [Candidatus Ornithospirochaeta sp.]
MENENKDKKEEIIGEVVSPDPKPQDNDIGGGENKKPEGATSKPNDKGEEKSGKNKENVYDKYRYWGSEPPKNGGSPTPNKGGMRNKFALIALIVLLISFFFVFFQDSQKAKATSVSYTDFMTVVEKGKVSKADIVGSSTVNFTTNDGGYYTTRIPYSDPELVQTLLDYGVQVTGVAETTPFWYILLELLPWIIFIALMVSMMRSTGAMGGGKLMGGMGKSLAKEYDANSNKTTFKDVAGQKEAKYELQEIVDFLKNPAKFTSIGAKIPKGCLLVGPPGTGKTLLARAVAGEAGVSFLHTSGSDFVEMFVGMGAARVRDLFEQGRKSAPCIIFIDELDAVGRSRGSGLGGGHDEREQTLNQMLVEMDGFSTDPGVIVIAATNRPDVLDPALLRPGRFDRQVTVALPDVQERLDILRIHTRKVKLAEDVDLARIARATPGTSGADLANLVNEAALFAARSNETIVDMKDFEEARDKILLGVAKKSVFMTEDEKRATAYHEAGHTLLHYYLKHVDPLHKVTIIPHGQALGLTMSLPEKDQFTIQKSYLMDRIKICMGGYCAEKIVYGETTTGTSNDIKQATTMAHRMVTEWGMSDLGFINLSDEGEPLFLGREITQHKDYSDETARRIDSEMNKILSACMDETMDILTTHRDQLDQLTEALVEKETLDDKDIREMFGFEAVKHVTDLR